MEADERRVIEQECRDLVIRLNYYSDNGDDEKATDLFLPDGTWIRGGVPYTGKVQMLSVLRQRPETVILRHLLTNIHIEVQDPKTAKGVTYYLAYRHDAGVTEPKLPLPLGLPFSMGEMHDKFVNTPSGWRLAHRTVKRLFMDPHATG